MQMQLYIEGFESGTFTLPEVYNHTYPLTYYENSTLLVGSPQANVVFSIDDLALFSRAFSAWHIRRMNDTFTYRPFQVTFASMHYLLGTYSWFVESFTNRNESYKSNTVTFSVVPFVPTKNKSKAIAQSTAPVDAQSQGRNLADTLTLALAVTFSLLFAVGFVIGGILLVWKKPWRQHEFE